MNMGIYTKILKTATIAMRPSDPPLKLGKTIPMSLGNSSDKSSIIGGMKGLRQPSRFENLPESVDTISKFDYICIYGSAPLVPLGGVHGDENGLNPARARL